MKIVAFLQNVRDLKSKGFKTVFDGLGGDLCYRIIWEVCIPPTATKPDDEHIFRVLQHNQPSMVITFGEVAEKAVCDKFNGWKMVAPHPDKGSIDAYQNLRTIIDRIETAYPEFIEALAVREYPLPPNEMIGLAVMMDKAAEVLKL